MHRTLHPFQPLLHAAVSLLFAVSALAAAAVSVKLVGVSDGDTVTVVMNGQQTKIRLYGIDAPEKAQPFGQVSTETIKQLTTGKTITVQPHEHDKYGRTVAMVYADGACINEALISSGNAWVYQQYCNTPICAKWLQLQSNAQSVKAGLWRENGAIPPWEWRHNGHHLQQKTITRNTAPPSKKLNFGSFVGNVQSKKFHLSGCPHADCKNCTAHFPTREQAIAAGYTPCKICNP